MQILKMKDGMWKWYVVLPALFAALTAILAKVGVREGIGGNVATAIRTGVVLLLAWGVVLFSGQMKEVKELNLLFLLLSGLATGFSWIFYFRSSDLSAKSCQVIQKVIHVQRKSKWDLKEIVNGIFYLTKNGCMWRNLPGEFPPWQTVYWYYSKWVSDGTWENLNRLLVMDNRISIDKKLFLK
jgi:uncharacterized membrane protein